MLFRRTVLNRGRFAGKILMALALALSCRCAWACQICLPAGMHSAAALVLRADAVVVGREDVAVPDFARRLRILKGDPDELASEFYLVGQPPHRLGARAREFVCARVEGQWQWVGREDGEFALLIGEILARAEDWQRDPPERVLYFSRLLGSKNRQVDNLAHLEVASAPYGQIRRISGGPTVQELRSSLGNFRLSRWHPLYILLLAQLAEEEDRILIEEKVRRAESQGNPLHLSAWATAWIEVAADPALQFLTSSFLEPPGKDFELVRQVLLALSVQGNEGPLKLRERMVPAYRLAWNNYPEVIPLVISDLLEWERWSFLPEAEAVLQDPPEWLKREDLIALQVYRSKALQADSGLRKDEVSRTERSEQGWSSLFAVIVVLLLVVAVTMTAKRAARGWP